MNILPQNTKEFLSKKYWDKFFGKLKQKGENEFFEWYGTYKNFEYIISKQLKTSASILNIGCGKSLFSEDMYDEGYKNIMNCDYSEQVIQDMQKRSEGIRPYLKYEVQDVFNMNYQDKTYEAILDKGCLDAVYPEATQENKEQVSKMFDQILRVGTQRYMLISLLQEHIIDLIIEFFGQNKNYKITIYEVLIEKSKLYPFLVDIQFSETPNQLIDLKLKGDNELKVLTFQEAKEHIKKIQLQNHFMSQIKKVRAGQRFNIDLWDPSNQVTPKYSLNIVDSKSKKTLENKTCGCFITPQGKENGYLFNTERGNFDLLEQTGLSRLIIAILNPGFVFDDLKKVQADLSPALQDVIPKGCSNTPVPFMTDADELGEKGILAQDNELVVEEIIIEEDVFRRLILKQNFNQVQSQFKLGYYAQSNQNKAYLKELQKDSLLPHKKNMYIGIDDTYLDFEAHRGIIGGLSLFKNTTFNVPEFKVLILGGGLCGLGKFFYNHFQQANIINVEISQGICDIARKQFEVQEDSRFALVCQDAHKYVNKKIQKKSKKNKKKEEQKQEDENPEQEDQQQQEEEEQQVQEYQQKGNPNGTDYIIIDINAGIGETSPPQQFLTTEFLEKLQQMLKPTTGVLAINVVAFSEKETKQIIQQVSTVFDIVYSCSTESELNEIIFAVNHTFERVKSPQQEDIILVDGDIIYDKKQQLEQNFKNIVKQRSKIWDQTMNIEECLTSLKLKIPKIKGNKFERTNYHLKGNEDGQTINLTKQQYQKDLGCINKQKQKKKQRKSKK